MYFCHAGAAAEPLLQAFAFGLLGADLLWPHLTTQLLLQLVQLLPPLQVTNLEAQLHVT
jgi:hypothetical protein